VVRLVEEGHQRGRRERHHDEAGDDATATEPLEAGEGDDGEQQVELLLHRERPKVAEHRWSPGLDEVGVLREDLPPVAHVEEGRGDVAPEPAEVVGRRDERRDDHEQQQDVEGGEESAGAPTPERAERDRVAASVLSGQERRDEVPRDGEEDLDTEEPPLEGVPPGVVGDDRQDRHGAESVDPRLVGQLDVLVPGASDRWWWREGGHRSGEKRGVRVRTDPRLRPPPPLLGNG